MTEAIYLHEDDWGLRSLYPLAAQSVVAADLEAAVLEGQANLDPSGYGWKAMHMIQEPSVDYTGSNLRLADVAEVLSPIMPRVTRFTATIGAYIGKEDRDPYGSYDDDAWCFGFDAGCFIKLEPEGELVKAIWFNFEASDSRAESAMRNTFKTVQGLVPSMLVDYRLDIQGPLGDETFVDQYFALQESHAIEVARRMEEYRLSVEAKKPWWVRLRDRLS